MTPVSGLVLDNGDGALLRLKRQLALAQAGQFIELVAAALRSHGIEAVTQVATGGIRKTVGRANLIGA